MTKRTALLIIITATATFLMAQERMRQRSPGGDLQLTAAQQQVWENARTDFEATAGPLFGKLQELDERMETALQNRSTDACSLGADLIAQHAIHEQIGSARETMRQKQQSVLTAEQKVKFDAFDGETMMKRRQ